ncbi:DUF1919 domain-containing protein, partial [bacterium]|nr:DUF1919 domain-containing protein [bacterium]
CYIEFLEDFNELIEVDLKFIQKSKYKISNEYRATNKHYYPIGVLNNVEIHFLHYKSEIEALDKWNYRKARINKKNMFIKFCDRDL